MIQNNGYRYEYIPLRQAVVADAYGDYLRRLARRSTHHFLTAAQRHCWLLSPLCILYIFSFGCVCASPAFVTLTDFVSPSLSIYTWASFLQPDLSYPIPFMSVSVVGLPRALSSQIAHMDSHGVYVCLGMHSRCASAA